MANKIRMNISISTDTRNRLQAYAEENHTSISQAITDWIWRQPVKQDTAPDAETEMEEK